jgi:16S rRNA G966 N2-methylase RsmD
MNQLYNGDNLGVLRDHIATESVDLIYLDPPFTLKLLGRFAASSGFTFQIYLYGTVASHS